jgi:hypothetical protein
MMVTIPRRLRFKKAGIALHSRSRAAGRDCSRSGERIERVQNYR